MIWLMVVMVVKKVFKGTIIDEDSYIISEKEKKELVEYRKIVQRFHQMNSNYSKYYKS